jgi:hypothetical protein
MMLYRLFLFPTLLNCDKVMLSVVTMIRGMMAPASHVVVVVSYVSFHGKLGSGARSEYLMKNSFLHKDEEQ